MVIRLDFLGDCARYPGLTELINEGQYLVPAMDRFQRTDAIVKPAEKGGKSIAWELLQTLLNDADDAHDQLPVLQHGLMRLWQIAADAPELTINHYRDEGIVSRDKASQFTPISCSKASTKRTGRLRNGFLNR